MGKPFIFRAWFISGLRRLSYRYPPHYEAYNKAKTEYYITSSKGTQVKRVLFTCASCGQKFPKKQVVKDHIDPVIDPETGFPIQPNGMDDWNTYIPRMFFGAVQILCKPCHTIKTNTENKKRRKVKKKVLHNGKEIVNIKKGKINK